MSAVSSKSSPNQPTGFIDPNGTQNQYLSKVAAEIRSKNVKNVEYQIVLGLVKGGKTFHGQVQIDFDLNNITPDYVAGGDNSSCLFIDYKGKMINKIDICRSSGRFYPLASVPVAFKEM